jgi:hypothetical protein
MTFDVHLVANFFFQLSTISQFFVTSRVHNETKN